MQAEANWFSPFAKFNKYFCRAISVCHLHQCAPIQSSVHEKYFIVHRIVSEYGGVHRFSTVHRTTSSTLNHNYIYLGHMKLTLDILRFEVKSKNKNISLVCTEFF